MTNFIGFAGRHATHKAITHEAHRRGWLNLRLGFALLRDRRVSLLTKLASLASGVVLTAILVAIEFPLEGLIGLLLPFLGLAFDFVFDGLEIVVLPLLVSAIVIRWLAPKNVVASLLG